MTPKLMTPEPMTADSFGVAAAGEPGAAALDRSCPDVYFTSGYGIAAASGEAGRWQVAYRRDRIIVPYLLRTVDSATLDAASPYGYSGIHVAAGCPRAELDRFWSRALDHWRALGVVSLFLRFSPLDQSSVAAALGLRSVRMTRRADTITVDVTGGPDAIWNRMAGRSRTAIRKARNTGLEANLRPAGADDVTAGSAFRRLYEQTMARVASTPDYLFPDVYYRRLADGLDKALSIVEVRGPAGDVVASALVLRHRDRAHYHLAGSDPAAARDGANNLLVWTILRWAAESGCAVAHLGGGVRPDDGLFRFKCSFGGRPTPFWTGAVVVDPARYEALLAARAAVLGRDVSRLRESGYFPAYRAG